QFGSIAIGSAPRPAPTHPGDTPMCRKAPTCKPALEALEDRTVPSGSNLIANGDFEGGNTGFTSQYTYSPGDIGPAGSYDVVDNPAHSRPHDTNPVSYADHTTGRGLMLAANGPTAPASASVLGPGNVSTTNGDQAFDLIAVDLNSPVSLAAGNYSASQFDY